MVCRLVLTSVLLVVSSTTVAGAGFLQNRGVATATVDELFLMVSPDKTKRLEELRTTLLPTYLSLPKNEHGKLEPSTVRYALSRYFVRTFGWYVRGMESNGDGWNKNSSAFIMEDQVPSHIMGLLEERVHGRGVDLSDLAIFAFTLTELIENDVTSGIEECYNASGLESTDDITDTDFDKVLASYLARHLYGGNEQVGTPADLERLERQIERMFPGWSDAKEWLKDKRLTVEWARESNRNPFVPVRWTLSSFDTAVHDIMHNFVEVAGSECPSLKARMVAIEYKGTGRVPLSDFYNQDHPLESAQYLRELGCLDESDPQTPMLLIANYMNSRANCLVDARYYSTCCVNECEELLLHVERKLQSPSVEPASIAKVVSMLPSNTVAAPRNLSVTLTQRLSEIANVHGGLVPLHGRLFSQWMHHAYPRECPYPHLSGSYQQISQEEFIEANDVQNVLVSEEEIAKYVSNPAYKDMADRSPLTHDSLPWNDQEEIFATHKVQEPKAAAFSNLIRAVMGCIAVLSMAVPLARTYFASGPTEKVPLSV